MGNYKSRVGGSNPPVSEIERSEIGGDGARQLLGEREDEKREAMFCEQLASKTVIGGLRKIFRKKNFFVADPSRAEFTVWRRIVDSEEEVKFIFSYLLILK